MNAEIDLLRAARIGAIGELMLLAIEPYRAKGEGILSFQQMRLLQQASAEPSIDLYSVALSLIGESSIEDVWEEEGGLFFVFEPVFELKPLPTEFAQAVRQHGIRLADAERVYRAWQADLPTMGESEFVRLCLRVVGLPVPAALPRHWQPGPLSSEALRRRGVTEQFIAEVLPEFLLFFNEAPVAGVSPDQSFFRFANKRWRQYVNTFDESTDYRPLPERWQPSSLVLRELGKRGVSTELAQRRLPEFRLYVVDRGHLSRHWGLEFIRYCERTATHGQ